MLVNVAVLQEQLSRAQAALEQWKANDSVQLEAARHDISKLKEQLEAQTESAKVASAQCKSAQKELKAARQLIATQQEASQSSQGELEEARQSLVTQHESTQSELSHVRQQLARQIETSKVQQQQLQLRIAELESHNEQVQVQIGSSHGQQEQMQLKIIEMETHIGQQAEQLSKAEEEAQKAARNCDGLKVIMVATAICTWWQFIIPQGLYSMLSLKVSSLTILHICSPGIPNLPFPNLPCIMSAAKG